MAGANAVTVGVVRLGAVLLMTAIVLVGRAERAAADEPTDEPARLTYVEADQFEYRASDGKDAFGWEAQGWVGGDYDKVWVKTRGEDIVNGGATRAELQLLYSRTITAFWDLQAGARYDVKPNPSRSYAVVGVQGLAPYFFEVDAAGFVSDEGDVSARLEVEYELLITQRLIAKPSAELDVAVQDVEELGIGSGVSEIELGLRIRYEIVRELAPYLGVSWRRKVGSTADLARQQGEQVGGVNWVGGVRWWF
ncbi:MAG: copper resistance protein B [Nitrospirota bacterium]